MKFREKACHFCGQGFQPRAGSERFCCPVCKVMSNITPQENGCWEWQGSLDRKGYGKIGWKGKTLTTSRVMMPDTDLHICHHCDNPKCCRPEHLFAGTMKENMQDCSKKGRINRKGFKGIDHPRTHLTELDIKWIRWLPCTAVVAAKAFSVADSTIDMIRERRIWKHIV